LQFYAYLHLFADMNITDQTVPKASFAIKIIFLLCGLGISSWAPMVPYAKERLQLNDSNLGFLLLLLGLGAISMMPVSGYFARRFGSRIVILCSAIIVATALPLLTLMNSVIPMGITLFIFGSAVGTVDVAMNAHGIQVQNLAAKPIMSSLHGLFSVGGLLGSLGLGFLIKFGLSPTMAAVFISALLLFAAIWSYPALLTPEAEKHNSKEHVVKSENNSFIWLNKSVLYLGFMCFAIFLSEGAMLDWSAIFLHENRGIKEAYAGAGYAAFSIAMATMRLFGDRLTTHFSGKTVVFVGCLVAAFGLCLAVFTPWLITALIGFILLGLGAANVVPIFISEGGKLKNVPASASIPAITTLGYAGQLAGPALLGFVAHQYSLGVALSFTAFLILTVALSYGLKK
jgi:predicted MFS family arabinose efflux permease